MSARHGRRLAPGPEWHPITEQLRAFEQDPLGFLQSTHRDYGDVVRLHLWPNLFHLIASPDAIHHVLGENHRNYHQTGAASSPGLSVNSQVLARRLSVTLRREQVHAFMATMTAVAEATFTRWESYAASGEPVDLADEMLRLTVAILTRTLFAAHLSDAELGRVCRALNVASTRTGPHLTVSEYQRLPARPDVELAEAARTLGESVAGLIAQRRGTLHGVDLLSALISTERSEDGLSEEQLRETVMVYLVAGHSTTASALTWTFVLLAQSVEAQACLRAEVDEVLGWRDPTANDLARMAYLTLVVREAMRLYPPVWMLAPRVALADDEIGGYWVPARSRILISPYVTHRHPEFWKRPNAFDPHRFSHDPQPPAYLPFGAGPWGCVGRHFGLVETLLVLALAVRRFRWEAVLNEPVEPDPQAALWPRQGVQMLLHGLARA
jgi:cytochrome P450